MADKKLSKGQKDVAHEGKRNLASLNHGRSKRLEDKIKYYENELQRAKESGNKCEMFNVYKNLEDAYKTLSLDENAEECRKKRLGLRVLGTINERKRKGTLNYGRRERYEGRMKFYEEKLVKTVNDMEADEVLSKIATCKALFENGKTLDHEIESRHPMWMKTSDTHQEKFNMLNEYIQKHPNKVKNINGVRVSFREEFCIGAGSDGTMVYIGLAEDGSEKAVKRMVRSRTGKLGSNEKEILNTPKAVNSKHVVNYWYYKEQWDEDLAYLILDLYEETLKQYVETQSQEILITNAPLITRHILEGLHNLHNKPKPILHRDLKPSNILRNVQGDWLLADFGISRTLSDENNTHETNESGTTYWRAAESIQKRYKMKSDIQVAGMVIFYILTKGDHPFGPEADHHQNLLGGNPVGLDDLADPVAKELISWMLQHDSKDRPSADEALKHPYLQHPDQQFELLECVGNQEEITKGDLNNNSSDVVRQLNFDNHPLVRTWKSHIPPDVLAYLCSDGKRYVKYGDQWTDCLRLMRNKSQHWNDQPRPRPKVHYDVGEPREYFLKVFPVLPAVVHRVIRSKYSWKERADLKKFF